MDNELTPSPNQAMLQESMPQTAGRNRNVRLFLYGLFILLCLLIIPAVILPFWLASKGIVINAISGISIGKKIVINEFSIAINQNTITMQDLTLEHFIDKESTIANESWRLSSPNVDIRLTPNLHHSLKQQALSLGTIRLTDTAFNLTDLSPPYVFSAHTRRAEVTFSRQEGPLFTQQINELNLVLTTEPYVTITGVAQHAEFVLFLPQDIQNTPYPLSINQGHFSLSWQGSKTPLAVHLANIEPQWPTIDPHFQQSGKDITLIMDLSQPTTSIKITGDSLLLDQPLHLPEFIDKPDDTHQGLHLGQAIASLAQLPFRKLRIRHFTYGNLIIQSRVMLETPLFQMNKPNRQAKFHLKGKALGPDPYNINVLIKHKGNNNAHLSAIVSSHDGNTLACHAQVSFSSPLPKQVGCDVNINHPKALANKLKRPELPHAVLSGPVVITATQTSITLKKHTPNHPIEQFQHVDKASYKITVSLPESVNIKLNQLSFKPPVIFPQHNDNQQDKEQHDKLISSLTLQTDGLLSLNAEYDNDTIKLGLAVNKENRAVEILRIGSKQLSSELLMKLANAECMIPLSATSPKVPTSEQASEQHSANKLRCSVKSQLEAKVNKLYPTPTTSLDTITLHTGLDLDWSNRMLNMTLSNNALRVGQLELDLGENWTKAQAQDLTLNVDQIHLTQHIKSNTTVARVINAIRAPTMTLRGKLALQQTIDGNESKTQSKKNNQPPVQNYSGRFALTLSDLTATSSLKQDTNDLSQAPSGNAKINLETDYHIELSLNQNKQHLPMLQSKGQLSLKEDMLELNGTVSNTKQTDLLLFSLDYNLTRSQADIRLHRNDIHFTPTQSLKNHYLPNLPIQYDLYTGTISFESRIKYTNKQWHGNIGLFSHNLGGYVHNMHFADLNISITTAFTPDGFRSIHPISLHAGYFNAGVLLENLFAVMEFDSQTPVYRLQRANAYIMGGSISMHDVNTTRLTEIPKTQVLVHGIELAKLIDTIDIKDIILTGTLDGTLPLAVIDGSPVVEHGILQARYPGGVLKYKEGSTIDKNIEAAGSNSLLVVSKILENYNYNTLAIHLNYSKSGLMDARSSFKGNNPDILSGRQVNLNLSVQENIPALLKTLSVINSSKLEHMFLKQMGVDE